MRISPVQFSTVKNNKIQNQLNQNFNTNVFSNSKNISFDGFFYNQYPITQHHLGTKKSNHISNDFEGLIKNLKKIFKKENSLFGNEKSRRDILMLPLLSYPVETPITKEEYHFRNGILEAYKKENKQTKETTIIASKKDNFSCAESYTGYNLLNKDNRDLVEDSDKILFFDRKNIQNCRYFENVKDDEYGTLYSMYRFNFENKIWEVSNESLTADEVRRELKSLRKGEI